MASLGQLSILLEVSSPKPGNVSRLRRFSDTGYRHFLASASLAGRGLHMAAQRGAELASNKLKPEQIGLGEIIVECSRDVFSGLNQRNTIFGTLLLHVPLVVAAGAVVSRHDSFSQKAMMEHVKLILDNSTVEDTINLYRAFHIVRPGGHLNKEDATWTEVHDRYDIDNPDVYENIRKDGITIQELFRMSAEVDPICGEWSQYYNSIINEVYPYLNRITGGLEDLEEGIVKTFIWQLSRQPDGLIAKKVGRKRAEDVRALAERIVLEGMNGRATEDLMEHLDEELRREGNLLNPGTTADFVSAAIFCKLVSMQFGEE
ncbi:MAG: triphosphoribosyl-dephospho-CoA synthase [Candidatus Thorarchaeota archaeon]